MGDKEVTCACQMSCPDRRTMLKATISLGLGLPLIRSAAAQAVDARKARPQENDRLVFFTGEKEGQVITPADLGAGERPIFAYPMEPTTGTIRNGSRLNQVLLVRLAPAALAAPTRANAAEGIVAYSAVCTHTGCPVSEWLAEAQRFKCPCHYSEFDPKEGARVVGGPAPKRLAMLPLKIDGGVLMAAGVFSGKVGFKR